MEKPFLRLNTFQQLMQQWKELAPYNAGTLLHIAGKADRARWENSIRLMVEELGVGRPVFSVPGVVSFVPVGSVVLESADDLERKTCEELNRFFICPGEGDSHWLGFMFDHWLTDGGTIAELVVRLVVRYGEPEAVIGYPAHVLNQDSFQDLFGEKVPPLTGAGPVREAARVRSEHREVSPLGTKCLESFATHFYQQPWPQGLLEKVQAQAKVWGGSAHDLLLAAVAQLLSPGQSEISLASVMDVRAEALTPVEGRFGQFISFYTNVIEQADQRSLEELTRQVAERNHRLKEEGRALKNFGALEAARLGWEKATSREEKAGQFHQLAPILAGVSHMKVTRLQREIGRAIARHRGQVGGYQIASPLLDATVVSPTGPLTPLLITVNKLNPHSVMMGISYRTAVYSRSDVETLARQLLGKLNQL